jgi:hypothetical protein
VDLPKWKGGYFSVKVGDEEFGDFGCILRRGSLSPLWRIGFGTPVGGHDYNKLKRISQGK